jgi:hypothetical protein
MAEEDDRGVEAARDEGRRPLAPKLANRIRAQWSAPRRMVQRSMSDS